MGGNQSLSTPELRKILEDDERFRQLKNRALKILHNITLESDNTITIQNAKQPNQITKIKSPTSARDIENNLLIMTNMITEIEKNFSGYVSYQ
jgi:hypothetical protein